MPGSRLKEEREKKLKLSQEKLGELAGAAKRTVIDWEKGVSAPTGFQLSALADAGVDVLYVLTGERGGTVLTARETAMLGTYRALSDKEQEAAQTLLDAAAQSGEVKKDNAA